MTKKSRILAGASVGVFALGAVASVAAPTYAAVGNADAWQQVTVTTEKELVLSGGLSTETVLEPTATGGAVSKAADALNVKGNVAWKLEWQAVSGVKGDTSKTGAAGTSLAENGFAAHTNNASIDYQGNNLVADGNNVWSAQIANTGSGNSLPGTFAPLGTTATTVWEGTATIDAALTPTYSADIDATLTNGTYKGTIYYKLSEV